MIKEEYGNQGVKVACELMGHNMGLGIYKSMLNGDLNPSLPIRKSQKPTGRLTRKSLLCRKRFGIKWLPKANMCSCRSGREWSSSKRACLYTARSKACQENYGKHYSTNKNRCICHKGISVYVKSKQSCQLKNNKKVVCDSGAHLVDGHCTLTKLSINCKNEQNGQYYSTVFERCVCDRGLSWNGNAKEC